MTSQHQSHNHWQDLWICPLTSPGVGIGYKPDYFGDIQRGNHPLNWLEIHAENYMMDGGPTRAQLQSLAKNYPISCHGVGLSIGSSQEIDADHLARLAKLHQWLQPSVFSEHLAWSTHTNCYLNDLLPVPYTNEVLQLVVDHICQVQDALACPMLIENPSTYTAYSDSTMREVDFLREMVKRSGCGLLLDVNNVYVTAINQRLDPHEYILELPLDKVGEVHLAGHCHDVDEYGDSILIDSHNSLITNEVWELYRFALQHMGWRPTLIEWDANLPDFHVLKNQANIALDALLSLPIDNKPIAIKRQKHAV